ncbi:hypothetical protein C8Q75DRAFT_786213 [Abortiporus biennis]|nr:hypothetical protein C8Q75DRAFT_786213 [Abortiporus biennis]
MADIPPLSLTINANDSPAVIENARKQLEDGIEQHRQTIISMQYRLNELTLVARLPPELLSEIFQCYVTTTLVDWRPYQPYRWIRLTHVCHHWRNVALRSPRLWADIAMTSNLEWMKELISRSCQVPLNLTMARSELGSGVFRRVVQELPRARQLMIRLEPYTYHSLNDVELPQNFPLLRSVVVQNPAYSYGDMKFPLVISKGSFPVIEQLDITGYILDWSLPIFAPTLTRLVLSPDVLNLPSANEALDAISKMPLLQHLELASVVKPMVDTGIPSSTHNITLPNLSYLCLSGQALACVFILKQLEFPAETTLLLELKEMRTEADVTLVTGPVVRQLLESMGGGGTNRTVRSFAIQERGDISTFSFWTVVHSLDTLALRRVKPHIQITFGYGVQLKPLLEVFCTALPLSQVESLYLGDTTSHYGIKGPYIKVLEKMPNVSQAQVDSDTGGLLSGILTARVDVHTDTHKPGRRRKQLLLRNLRLLILHDVRFRPASEDWDDDSFVEGLVKAFKGRNKSRCNLAEW